MVFDLSVYWYQFILLAIAGYFVGCFNFAVLISKLKKRDITKIGSGNPGSMNMTREFGPIVGFTTFFLDTFKGGVPAVIAYFCYREFVFAGTNFSVSWFAAFLCGFCAVLGHVFPVTMKFKGGKGVASAIGLLWLVLGIVNPWNLLIGLLVIISLPFVITLTRIGSLWSIVYVTVFGIWQTLYLVRAGYSGAFYGATLVLIFAVVALVWGAHHKNIRCLFAGEEHETVMLKFLLKKK